MTLTEHGQRTVARERIDETSGLDGSDEGREVGIGSGDVHDVGGGRGGEKDVAHAVDDAVAGLHVDEAGVNEDLGVFVDAGRVEVDHDGLGVERLGLEAVGEVGRPDFGAQSVIDDQVLEVVDPLWLEKFGHDSVGEGVEGRVGRSEDGEGAVAGEDFVEAGGIDGGGQSRELRNGRRNLVDGLVLGVGFGREADSGDDGESVLSEDHGWIVWVILISILAATMKSEAMTLVQIFDGRMSQSYLCIASLREISKNILDHLSRGCLSDHRGGETSSQQSQSTGNFPSLLDPVRLSTRWQIDALSQGTGIYWFLGGAFNSVFLVQTYRGCTVMASII